MSVIDHDPVPYHTTLQIVGAHLEAHGATFFQLIEVLDGYCLQYSCTGPEATTSIVRLSFDHLRSHRAALGRGKLLRRMATNSISGVGAMRYESMLRTMGDELDTERAHFILLDQVDDGIFVSYQYLDPSSNYRTVKRYVLVQTPEHPVARDSGYPRVPMGDLVDQVLANPREQTPPKWGHIARSVPPPRH